MPDDRANVAVVNVGIDCKRGKWAIRYADNKVERFAIYHRMDDASEERFKSMLLRAFIHAEKGGLDKHI